MRRPPISLTKSQRAILHIARKQLGLTDAEYRSALVHLVGCTSSAELDAAGFHVVMGFFDYLGFKPAKAGGEDFGARPGMATFAQLELIRSLWGEWADNRDMSGLPTWLKRTFKVDSLRFLTLADARKAITALKAMKARERA